MGACNCKEDDDIDNGNIYASEIKEEAHDKHYTRTIVAPKTSVEQHLNSSNLEISNSIKLRDMELLDQEKSIKMAEYQTREAELPFSQYASVQVESERGENQFNFNNIENDTQFKENDGDREENSIVLSFDQEYKYAEISTNILNFLNSLRTTPEKFENEYDQSKINVKNY
jgi:hypothetical protein